MSKMTIWSRLFPMGPVTFRWSLIRGLILLVFVVGVSVMIVTLVAARMTVQELSKDLIDRKTQIVQQQLHSFFGPLSNILLIGRDGIEDGTLDRTNAEWMTRFFMPILARVPQISSINTGDPTGHGFMLLRDPQQFRTRQVNRADPERDPVWHVWQDVHTVSEPADLNAEWILRSKDYDPRDRPWYIGAMATGGFGTRAEARKHVHWTAPYTFFTTKDPGLTASVRGRDPEGHPFVLALDLLLTDITDFTIRLSKEDEGVVLITSAHADMVIGLPGLEAFDDPDARRAALLKPLEELGSDVLRDGLEQWDASGRSDRGTMRFKSGDRWWWAGVSPFELSPEHLIYSVVVVPESDLLGDVQHKAKVTLLGVVPAVAIALLMAWWMARRHIEPLEALVERSDRMGRLELDPDEPVASAIVEIDELAIAQERMRSALNSFARYVPVDLVRDLVARGEAARIGGRTETLTVLFTDIKGFTSVAESLPPETLVAQMAVYFETMLSTLSRHNATIDKLVGDSIVAFWGAPEPNPQHQEDALCGVLACREVLAAMNAAWVKEGQPELRTRFGMATGQVVVGNVGSPSRLTYTVLGDTVNLASRLEGLNREYGTEVLITESLYEATRSKFAYRLIDVATVRGKSDATRVYELLGAAESIDEDTREFVRAYESGLELYHQGRSEEAAAVFGRLAAQRPDDGAARRLLALCQGQIDGGARG